MKYPPEMFVEYTQEDPKKLRHWRVMAELGLHRRRMAERKQRRAAESNRRLARGEAPA